MNSGHDARCATGLIECKETRNEKEQYKPIGEMQKPITNQQNDGAREVPRHVAIIMDGNGRWARQRGLARTEGHVKGVETVRKITEAAREAGVEYLTLYTFSKENWNRPADEVEALMHLIVTAIERETPDLIANGVRLMAIGDIAGLPEASRERLQKCMEQTAGCMGMTLVLALNYSARWEITEACRRLAGQALDGIITPGQIDEQMVGDALATAGIPDPDLLIRTGGESRVSNFLLWQIAYAELLFTDKFWPDFDKEDFGQAIKDYQSRERRFGKTSEQLKEDRKGNYAQ